MIGTRGFVGKRFTLALIVMLFCVSVSVFGVFFVPYGVFVQNPVEVSTKMAAQEPSIETGDVSVSFEGVPIPAVSKQSAGTTILGA